MRPPGLAHPPVPLSVAIPPSPIANPHPSTSSKAFVILAGAVALGAVAGFFVFLPGTRTRKEPKSVVVVATAVAPSKQEEPPQPIPTAELAVPSEVAPPTDPVFPDKNPLPAKSRVEITVQPADAVLSVDKRVVEGNQFRLDAPKKKTLHVVQALASGYIPFKRTISYANDVFLDIQLTKAQSPASRAAAKAPASPVTAQPRKTEANVEEKFEPRVAPPSPSVEDFGMNLERPNIKRPTKKIDETDPYAP